MNRRGGTQRSFVVACVAAAVIGLDGASVAGSAGADTIQTVVGTGVAGYSGDGGQAREASIDQPRGASPISGGGIVWAGFSSHTVRLVAADGIVTTVAGTPGRPGRSGDGGPASKAKLDRPNAAVWTSGGVLIVDTGNNRIRLVDAKGVMRTIAGIESAGYSGDGGPATAARLRSPTGIALVPDGGFLIADTGNHAIRRVSADGQISTVAGTGRRGYSGAGDKATAAQLSSPFAVAVTADGGFVVADTGNQRIRWIAGNGTITTIAGTGTKGYGGDGGPAMSALLTDPRGVAVLPGGAILVADTGNHRIRQISAGGTISTFAGTGAAGFSGDGGAAVSAQLATPESVSVTSTGGVLIADSGNSRIRFIGVPTRPANVARPTIVGESAIGRTLTASAGGWRGTGPAISYRWQRCQLEGTRCSVIGGANEKTYRVRALDFGSILRVAVTATNAAGAATSYSDRTGVGRLVKETFLAGADGTVRGVLSPGSEPRVSVELSRGSVDVVRRPLAGSKWETSVGVVGFDTRPLRDRLRLESASLLLAILKVQSTGRAQLLVRLCPDAWPITAGDFRAFPPRGDRAAVPLGKLRRGRTVVPVPVSAVSLDGPTKLCLYVSGRVPRSGNVVRLASLEFSEDLASSLVITRRVR